MIFNHFVIRVNKVYLTKYGERVKEKKAEIGLFSWPSVTNGSFIPKAVSTVLDIGYRRVLHLGLQLSIKTSDG